MLRYSILVILAGLFLGGAAPASADTVFSLWPLVDYRSSERLDYNSFHLLGPLFKYEVKGQETEYALRPLFYRASDDKEAALTEVLYPLSSTKRVNGEAAFHLLHLLNVDTSGTEEGNHKKFYLFPFLFYGDHQQHGRYFAFFPVGGKLHGWFGRDTIEFWLFPLYSQTHKGARKIDNVLWPFFAKIDGENETGFKVWPLYGQSQKTGHYRKRFFLWPFFARESLRLNTDNPVEKRSALPFYYSHVSPKETYRSVFWPFFSKRTHHEKDYREWYAPWPLVRFVRGATHYGNRLLPFYADETMEVRRRRWYLWPIYKIEQMETDLISRRRDRVLFFLYSDRQEVHHETGENRRRMALWPLFQFQRRNGVSHFSSLALLEPFFPGNEGIERSWAPLWRVYQQKWDQHGNHMVSLLWNLYWREQRGDDVAWELFPLIEYREEQAGGLDMRLLKGLLRYRSGPQGQSLNLLYLPWAFSWGT